MKDTTVSEMNSDQFSSLEALTVCNDLFGATWHSSYVRFIEVMSTHIDRSSINLAFAVANQRSSKQGPVPVESLLVETLTIEALNDLVVLALSELATPDHDINSALISVLQKIEVSRAESIFGVRFKPGFTSKVSHDIPIPRDAAFWRDGEKAHYLAIHHES